MVHCYYTQSEVKQDEKMKSFIYIEIKISYILLDQRIKYYSFDDFVA